MAPRSRAIYPRSERKACTAPIRRPCCASRSKSAAANTGPSGERTRRSRCSCKEVAEREGFEPPVPDGYNRFRVCRIRPLCHLSAVDKLKPGAILSARRDALLAAHIAPQGWRDDDGPVRLLIVLED